MIKQRRVSVSSEPANPKSVPSNWPHSADATPKKLPTPQQLPSSNGSLAPAWGFNPKSNSPSWVQWSPQNPSYTTGSPASLPAPPFSFKASSPSPGVGASPTKASRKQHLREQYHSSSDGKKIATDQANHTQQCHSSGHGWHRLKDQAVDSQPPRKPMSPLGASLRATDRSKQLSSSSQSPPASPRQLAQRDQVGRTRLHYAVMSKDPHTMKPLLDAGKPLCCCWESARLTCA